MPQTIEQVTIDATARVITEHFPQRGGLLCYCGEEWTPRHVATALYAARLLTPVRAHPGEADPEQTVLVSWSGKRHYKLAGGRVLHDGSARAMCSDATYGKEPDADGDVTWGTKKGSPSARLALCKSCVRSAVGAAQR